MDSHLELKILRAGDTLMVSLAAHRGGAEGAVTLLEAVHPDWAEVGELCAEVARHLTAQRQPRGVLGRMERAGQALLDQLLGPRVKRAMRERPGGLLTLHLHTSLLELPWELLHDGEQFLCLRFALGRIALAEEDVVPPAPSPPGERGQLLIIADPRGDLPHAEAEGQSLLDLAAQHPDVREPDLLSAPTTRRKVLECLRTYELVHLAGHGEGGGWLLEDGALTAADLSRLRGGRVPALVFANACASGAMAGWDPGAGAMARVFLVSGSRHFIGASCELPDHTGAVMALRFYDALWRGTPIGECLRQGREVLAADRSLPPLAWAGYVLYGDPAARYAPRPEAVAPGEPDPELVLVTPQGERPLRPRDRPPAPRRPTRLTPAQRRRLALRVALGALLGILIGAAATLEALKPLALLDAMWLAGLQRDQGPRPFVTQMVLLGVDRRVSQPRGLYLALLEGLAGWNGPGPDVIALDTWFRDLAPGEAPTAEDLRLTDAMASVLERSPIVLGQKWDPASGRPLPPPAWLMDGIRDALRAHASARCGGCAVSGDPPFWDRLGLGHVAVERVVEGIFWDLDHRVRFSCDGRGVPFSWRVAFPRDQHEPVCRGGGFAYGVSGESVRIPLDVAGRMLLAWRGRASWTGAPTGLRAFDLRTVATGWAAGDTSALSPGDLAGQVVLVGRAQADAEASDADRRRTPLGEMYGVEVQANAIEALRQRAVPAPSRPAWILLAAALVGALTAAWAGRPRAAVRSAVLGALILLGTWALWEQASAVLSPVAPLVSVAAVGVGARLARMWRRRPLEEAP